MEQELVLRAIEVVKENKEGFSINLLQRKLKIGYIKCSKLIDALESKGIIGPYNAKNNSREVYIK